MDMDNTNLRQAENVAKVTGKVSDISLEKLEAGTPKEHIKGNIFIKTSDTNVVRVGVFCSKYTSERNLNEKVYPGINTVMEQYKSIASYGEEEADVVTVKGSVDWYREGPTYKSNFFTRVNKVPEEYEATFDVEVYIDSTMFETDADGEETGRIIINGWVPMYKGIKPIKIIADTDLASEVDGYFEVGSTYKIFGKIVSSKTVTKNVVKAGIGKDKIEEKVTYVNELIMEGATEEYVDEKAFDPDAVKLSVQEYKDGLKDAQNKANNHNTNNKPSGMASGRTLSF